MKHHECRCERAGGRLHRRPSPTWWSAGPPCGRRMCNDASARTSRSSSRSSPQRDRVRRHAGEWTTLPRSHRGRRRRRNRATCRGPPPRSAAPRTSLARCDHRARPDERRVRSADVSRLHRASPTSRRPRTSSLRAPSEETPCGGARKNKLTSGTTRCHPQIVDRRGRDVLRAVGDLEVTLAARLHRGSHAVAREGGSAS